ncbi:MAG: hypothetical protein HQK51_10180 [Oligoflexia bacterium]|nr:hypothetical protein [Oligoflexia bacterium]
MMFKIKKVGTLLIPLAMLFSAEAFATRYTYCKDGTSEAYSDPSFSANFRSPDNDKICRLPIASDMGADYTLRCQIADASICRINEGGVAAIPGSHDVPSLAWYFVEGRDSFKNVRCRCGCFSEDTMILTSYGELPIGSSSANANQMPLSLAILRADGKGLDDSEYLTKSDFTRGPEKDLMLKIETANGQMIKLTKNHPVLVSLVNGGHNSKEMVQAQSLKVGSNLVLNTGATTVVTKISAFKLPEEANHVFNVDTKAQSAEGHIIVANELLMGDIKWQERLSERESRSSALLN